MTTNPMSGSKLENILSLVGAAQSETDTSACCARALPLLLDLAGSSAGFIYVSDPRLPEDPLVVQGLDDVDRTTIDAAKWDWLDRLDEMPKPAPVFVDSDAGGLLVLPIQVGERLVGLAGWRSANRDAPDAEAPWSALSTWLGALLDSHAARASLERRLLHYDTFVEMSSLLARSVGLAESLEIVLFSSMSAVSAEAASLLLLDETKASFRFAHTHGVATPRLSSRTFSAEDGIAGRVLRTQEAEVVEDAAADSQFYGRVDAETGFVTRNLIAVPLMAGDEPVGVLEVLNRAGGGAFTSEDRLLLLAVADQIAYAIRNAETFDHIVNAYCKRRRGDDTCDDCPQPLDKWAACRAYRERLA